ncbi:UNVERIFIED_CONTAM: V-type proton ATPase subunit H [Gekko kuhli]
MENHQRVSIFFDYAKRGKNTAWSYFLPMLNRQDLFTVHMAARIIAKLAAWGRELMEGSDLNYYFNWIKTQLSSQKLRGIGSANEPGTDSSQYVQCVAGCLQLMLRVNEYRFAWVESDGVNCIMGVLSNKCGFQLQYQMIFSIWLLAFSPQMCEYLRRYNIVPVLSDILQESVKEKVTRIILAAFRNLLEKSTERETRQEYALAMIQCKVLKQLENLEQQKYDDEDISEDIKFLLEKLGESVQDLSSFDEYSSELKSGRLEWSPVHKSEKFWRENARPQPAQQSSSLAASQLLPFIGPLAPCDPLHPPAPPPFKGNHTEAAAANHALTLRASGADVPSTAASPLGVFGQPDAVISGVPEASLALSSSWGHGRGALQQPCRFPSSPPLSSCSSLAMASPSGGFFPCAVDLGILTKLLEVSDDPQVLAVAAHDVGEYVRHYPRGKRYGNLRLALQLMAKP